jgi:hypothetical protein
MREPLLFQTGLYQLRLLQEGTREQIIEWLQWNDPNGCYSDHDAEAECGGPLTLEQAKKIMREQISTLTIDYAIPDELASFIDAGFLVPLSEKPEEKTVAFGIPSLRYEDENGAEHVFTLTWIHPDFNKDFCHFYEETPGDLANFFIEKETRNGPSEQVEDLESMDDLIAWLQEKQRQ